MGNRELPLQNSILLKKKHAQVLATKTADEIKLNLGLEAKIARKSAKRSLNSSIFGIFS